LGIPLARKTGRRNVSVGPSSLALSSNTLPAQAAVNGLRMWVNEDRNPQREQSILLGDLVDHFIETELSAKASWRSQATKIIYAEFLKRWIRPNWGTTNIRDVRTVGVENWLRQLRRVDGDPLANATKAKIRNLMSLLFNHAIRYEWLDQGKNPITFVRQSAQRKTTPEVLEAGEIQSLLSQLESPFRLMVLLDVTSGLRRCELLALKWSDIDFIEMKVNITRSIYHRVVVNRRGLTRSLKSGDCWNMRNRMSIRMRHKRLVSLTCEFISRTFSLVFACLDILLQRTYTKVL